MRKILLTQGYVTQIDDEDYEELSKYRWHAQVTHNGPRAARHSPVVNGKRKTVLMHRVILGAPPGMEGDHKDHDTLNNQRANLRVCTHAQNSANQRKRAGCSSRFKGVYWHRASGKWHAYIRVAGRRKSLGYHDDEVDAAQRYNVEAVREFGEFALLNDI